MKRKATAIEEFDPARIRPLPGQPRKRFGGIKELADSIAEIGQSCPGIVTLVDDDPAFDAQLVDGERRLRACKIAKAMFRAEVVSGASADDLFVASFAANFGKQDHDAIEIAEALARMQTAGKSVEQMKRIAGKSDCWIYQHLNLLKLHPEVQAMMVVDGEENNSGRNTSIRHSGSGGNLSFSVAQLLVPLDEPQQLTMARKITRGEGMGLVAARRMVLKARSRSGDKTSYKSTARRLSLSTIETIVADFTDRIGVYLDMPGADINALIDGSDNRTKVLLMEQLEEAADSLAALGSAIKSRLPQTRRQKAGTA